MNECRKAAYVAKEIKETAVAILLKKKFVQQTIWDETIGEGQFT